MHRGWRSPLVRVRSAASGGGRRARRSSAGREAGGAAPDIAADDRRRGAARSARRSARRSASGTASCRIRPSTGTCRSSARRSRRPARARTSPWTFIVLDTDGVNAFAAPGGYIHITRGALALMTNEAELGGVLAHEIIHVTEQAHDRRDPEGQARPDGRRARRSWTTSRSSRGSWTQATDIVMAGFGRAEEIESDTQGRRARQQGRLRAGRPRRVPDAPHGAQQGSRPRSRACSPRTPR